jgi:hypothetical protein
MKKQVKETNTKKFNLEKFEVAKLTTMRKIVGGVGGDGNGGGNDDITITDILDKIKTH